MDNNNDINDISNMEEKKQVIICYLKALKSLFENNSIKNENIINCYSSSDKEIASYYVYLNNKAFYPYHFSCKECKNIQSCNIYKDGYYFKYENNNINKKDICYTSTVEN